MRGVPQMGGDERFVRVARKPSEDLRVLQEELEESPLPRPSAHRVEEGQVPVAPLLQQQGAQRHRPADVVRHDAGAGQAPVVEEPGEVLRVGRQAQVLALALLGLAEAEMVEEEDLAGTGERGSDVPPQEGGVRGAVHQHEGVSAAQGPPPDHSSGRLERLVQCPVHRRSPLSSVASWAPPSTRSALRCVGSRGLLGIRTSGRPPPGSVKRSLRVAVRVIEFCT